MFQSLLLVAVLLGADKPLDDRQLAAIMAKAVTVECNQLDAELIEIRKRIKTRDRSPDSRRNKIMLKKRLKATQKRIKQLKSGKVQPGLRLDPFKLKEGQLGYLPPRGREGGDLRVAGSAADGVMVRCRGVTHSTRGYSGGSRLRTSSKVSWSTPFFLKGVRGSLKEKISAPQCLWYVTRSTHSLRLVPVK